MRLTKLGSFGLEADTISPDFRKVWDAFFAGQILVFRNQKLEAAEFLVDKIRATKNNADFFDSMRRG